MKISVLGAGTWGTALSILLSGNGHTVTLWSALSSEVEQLSSHRKEIKNLPGAVLPKNVTVTACVEAALAAYDLIVFAVASPYVRNVAHQIAPLVHPHSIIVNVAKGIEERTLMTLTEVIADEIPDTEVCVLSGPSHAEEVSRSIPTTIVVGAAKKSVALTVQDVFMNKRFRVYTSPDIIGIELGGSLKNVIALAAGVLDGIGFGDNTKAALMTRGIAEISRLGIAMGGKYETFSGLSGIGDLFVTCTSHHSRNWNAGYYIGKGKTAEEAMKEVNQVVEGVYCAKAALALSEKYNVEMPIVKQVNDVLFQNKSALEAATELFERDRTEEHSTLEWNEE